MIPTYGTKCASCCDDWAKAQPKTLSRVPRLIIAILVNEDAFAQAVIPVLECQ
jgi:hypothetical protein